MEKRMRILYCLAMIQSVGGGSYRLYETKSHVKVVELAKEKYIWLLAPGIGEILVLTTASHRVKNVLSVGNYRMYKVKNEPDFTDLLHLELFVGNSVWQGYLLPTGLPTNAKKRRRIIPTKEIIMKATL